MRAQNLLAKLLVATNNMKFETADDLLTWKNMEVEENTVVEFAELYENLTDEQCQLFPSELPDNCTHPQN